MLRKFIILIAISFGLGILAKNAGFTNHQAIAISIFSASVIGTLLFWDFRLAFVLTGTSILLITKTVNLESVVEFASLDVILFLIGMMVLVGFMKENGFFSWIVQTILRMKNMTAFKFVVAISVISAALSTATSEVVSIIFMVAAVLEICDYFEIDPVPFIIISVLATNVGSAATVLGNPIGILIARKAGLTFEDFITKALPLSIACLGATIFMVILWYRKTLKQFNENLKRFKPNEFLIKLISIPPDAGLKESIAVFGITLLFISLHHRFELLLNLEPNTILLTMPLLSSGIVMIWKRNMARHYIEKDVEWWTLLFFMLLFIQAGTLKYSGVTDVLAKNLALFAGNSISFLTGLILWISTIGSSILDNVVLVAAFIPVIHSFQDLNISVQPLWWALLFGGCLGGNITLVGSTANIIALGILEKDRNIRISFLKWFWIGLTVGIVTTFIVWIALLYFPLYK